MRIALVVPLYLPELQGGATLVVRRLAREFQRLGHAPFVFSGRATAAEPLGEVARGWVDGIPTWRVNLGHAFTSWTPANDLNEPGREGFARFLRATGPQIIHVHGLQGLGVGVIEAAGEAGVPVVSTMHDWWWLCPCLFLYSPGGSACSAANVGPGCPGRPAIDDDRRRRVLAAALPSLELIVVPAPHVAESLVRGGLLPAERIEIQPNGVERAKVGLPPVTSHGGPLRLAFLGGAGNELKGFGILLDALERLPRELPIVLDAWATDPSALDGRALLKERVRTHPPFAIEQLDEVLGGADVVVLPSRISESFSLVVREALLRRRAVITTDCGGPLEVIEDGRNGLVVARDSPEELARALERLARDPALVRRLAAAPLPEIATPQQQAEDALVVYRDQLECQARPGATLGLTRRLLFLSGIDGASLRYRVWTLARALEAAGMESEVLAHSDVRAPAAAEHCDLLILHRAPFSRIVRRAVEIARRRGVPVVFSADDLVFRHEDLLDAPALDHLSPQVVLGYRTSVEAYARSLAASDAFLGSTEGVAVAAESLGIPALVVRNGIDPALIAVSREARARRSLRALGGPRRMGFFSGTDTHDADLESIAPALANALARLPDARLVLAGPLRCPEVLERFRARIECRPLVPWSELPASLADLDVALAPLDLGRRFNLAKSGIKLLEAALVDVPTVASPSPPFQQASAEGALGWLADGASAWEEAVVRLLSDDDLARHLGRSARHWVERRYGATCVADEAVKAIEAILSRGPRAGAELPEPVEEEAPAGSCVALEPAGARYDAWQLEADAVERLEPGRPIEQRLVCRDDGVWRVDLRVCTFWRPQRQSVLFSVMDENEKCLGRRAIAASGFVDRAFVSIGLDHPREHSAGQVLRLRIEAQGHGGGEVEPLGLWTAADESTGLRVGGEALPRRSLSLRSFTSAPG